MEELFKSIFSKVCRKFRLFNLHVTSVLAQFAFYVQQWEVKAPMPSHAMRSAVKQITKLHESLSLVLPETQVEVGSIVLYKEFTVHKNEMSLQFLYFGVWGCSRQIDISCRKTR